MRILVIADPQIPVPPTYYGGAERIIAILCQELQHRGHEVTLMARYGSRNYGRLIMHQPPNNASYLSRAYRKLLFQPRSLIAARDVDVVHNFGRLDYLVTLLKLRHPLVVTFENPILEKEVSWLLTHRTKNLRLTSVSDHQRSHVSHLGKWWTVHNAVDTERFPFVEKPLGERYLAFLGRLTANKGVHIAIKVAKATGMKLKIAGNISDEFGGREYFESQVRPNLDCQVEWVGQLNDEQKAPFLGNATALLFPIQWDEPFGIVMAEALACGTPIIATKRASTFEVIMEGVTGFLCQDEFDMANAVNKLDRIRRTDCRTDCENRFSAKRMVDHYLKIYKELIDEK